jgi:hypothetical protein
LGGAGGYGSSNNTLAPSQVFVFEAVAHQAKLLVASCKQQPSGAIAAAGG